MREIKFRAWDEEKIRMYSGDEIEAYQDLNAWLSYGGLAIYRIEEGEYTELKPLQFTGLLDRDDKEIYEGDICTIWMGVKQDNPYIVEDLRELYLDMNHTDSYYRITMIEVIGNIYENPELLEQNK